MATKSERISHVLRALRQGTPEVIGASVVSADGLIVASVLPSEIDEDLIGGMSASPPTYCTPRWNKPTCVRPKVTSS